MNYQDKRKIKRIFEQISKYSEDLEAITQRVKEEEERGLNDDWDPVPETLETATSLLFKCYYTLEEVINS